MPKPTKKQSERAAQQEKKEEERAFLLDFIEVYRSLPSLWMITSESYHDRDKKNSDFASLLEKYNEYYPSATLAMMKTKLNTLRTNYRAELKKEVNWHSGMDGDDVYVSDKWFYSALSFLRDHEVPVPSKTSFNVSAADEQQQNISNNELPSELRDFQYEDQEDTSATTSQTTSSRKNSKRGAADNTETRTKLLKLAVDKLSTCTQSPSFAQLSPGLAPEYTHTAQAWAYKLAKLDDQQRFLAEKAINDVLFEAAQGTLRKDSIYINPTFIAEP